MNEEVLDEERRLRRLRFIVDFALNYVKSQRLTHEEAIRIVEGVRRHALKLFPGKEEAFEIIYAPRFRRALNKKFQRS
jgi:hypothetical protein